MHSILQRYRKIVAELAEIPTGLVCMMRPTHRGSEAISFVFESPFRARQDCNKADCGYYYEPVCKQLTSVWSETTLIFAWSYG